jgi:hypothetical protein
MEATLTGCVQRNTTDKLFRHGGGNGTSYREDILYRILEESLSVFNKEGALSVLFKKKYNTQTNAFA